MDTRSLHPLDPRCVLLANIVPVFYDPQSKQIMMWVARDGRRFGFRSHMHLGAAVALGVVPDDLARELLRDYFARLTASGFTRYEWGLPLFLDPVPAVCHNNWKGKGVEPDGSDQVGMYQNGSIHAHQTYYILQALYKTGMRREANALFAKMTPLVRRGELCGGLHSGLDLTRSSSSCSRLDLDLPGFDLLVLGECDFQHPLTNAGLDARGVNGVRECEVATSTSCGSTPGISASMINPSAEDQTFSNGYVGRLRRKGRSYPCSENNRFIPSRMDSRSSKIDPGFSGHATISYMVCFLLFCLHMHLHGEC